MKHLLHLTHKSNLARILKSGRLFCDSILRDKKYARSGDNEIKNRRSRAKVPVAAKGVVADYVPFYFAPRSPMLYSIFKGNVPECGYKQWDIIYLVFHSDDLFASKIPCCFTDKNAAMYTARFATRPDMLESDFIDWPLMEEMYWNNTPDDTERKERRMAEFLAHRAVPVSLLRRIVVYNQPTFEYITKILNKFTMIKGVDVISDWYF